MKNLLPFLALLLVSFARAESVLSIRLDGHAYYLEGRSVKWERLGDELYERSRKFPETYVIIESSTSLEQLSNVQKLLMAAGYQHVRYFFADSEKRMMGEVSFLRKPPIPYRAIINGEMAD
ncbi:hypothetical protein [Andreprevotia lacus]|jgi:hypothetical protein|uniref:hypothetical protein n=1 Tax=Andreprevotia lacus TaxID=1121000 RepID=UPI00111C73A2|nr:hypothetical protein [Andreprevotia lacus]